MKLTNAGIENLEELKSLGYGVPEYDREQVTRNTKENPFWIHFGAGNIFRAFQANVVQNLLNSGELDRGIIVAEGYDYEIMKALYEIGFDGPIRPDHGRMIWDEVAMPGYGLYDRALGATYLNGLWEAIEKSQTRGL